MQEVRLQKINMVVYVNMSVVYPSGSSFLFDISKRHVALYLMPSCKSEESQSEEPVSVVQIYVNTEVYSWPISVVGHVDIKDTVHV